MAQDGKMTSTSAPPFATGDGKPTSSAAGKGAAGHDFTKDPKTGAPPVPGRDFTKESRSQSEARPEVEPSKGEIPAGGKDLKADPSGPSGNSGANEGVHGR